MLARSVGKCLLLQTTVQKANGEKSRNGRARPLNGQCAERVGHERRKIRCGTVSRGETD